ncbi:unnamed protein product [Prunus armeniaca]
MTEEIKALHQTNTWTLVPSHPSQNIIGCKWVYRIKTKQDGSIDMFKARLIAKGYHQMEGLDNTETFSHVAKPPTIRLMLSLAVQFDWPVTQLDVSNAFLHGSLTETVFMQQPPGFKDPHSPHHVFKLNRSLYGLKQSPRAWYEELYHCLLGLGFHSSIVDSSLFIKDDATLTIIIVYRKFINILHSPHQHPSKFSMKNLDDLHYFLGIEAHRTPTFIFLSQAKYIIDLLTKTKMLDAKPCSTPSSTIKLDTTSGDLVQDPAPYHSLADADWASCPIEMLTGQVVQLIDDPPLVIVFSLALTFSLGVQRNKPPLHAPLPKVSIVPSLTQLLKSHGYVLCSRIFTSSSSNLLSCFAIMLVLLPSLKIPYFMLALNTLRSIITTLVNLSQVTPFLLVMSPLTTKLLTYLPKLAKGPISTSLFQAHSCFTAA